MIKYYRYCNLKLAYGWKEQEVPRVLIDWSKINYACRNVSIVVNYILRVAGFSYSTRAGEPILSNQILQDDTVRYWSRGRKIMTCFTMDNGSGAFQGPVRDNYILMEKWKFRSTGSDTCSRLSIVSKRYPIAYSNNNIKRAPKLSHSNFRMYFHFCYYILSFLISFILYYFHKESNKTMLLQYWFRHLFPRNQFW